MLAKRTLKELERIVGTDALLVRPEHVLVYECDGTTAFKSPPEGLDSEVIHPVVLLERAYSSGSGHE